jgi:hypothetical protein
MIGNGEASMIALRIAVDSYRMLLSNSVSISSLCCAHAAPGVKHLLQAGQWK